MPTGKLVTLKLDGNRAGDRQGWRVTLELAEEGDRPFAVVHGGLPPNPDLLSYLSRWQHAYRRLDLVSRIKPKEIIYGGMIQQRQECDRWAREVRHGLAEWLESESFRPIDRRLREELSLDEPIRLLIQTEEGELRRLPWHLWSFIERFTQAEVGFCRAIAQRPALQPGLNKDKIRILAILGNSDGIDVATDRRLLETLPGAEVLFLVEPQPQQINDQLWEQPWDILFFAGHSETHAESGRMYINAEASLTLEELRYGLRQAIAHGLRLAIFNSCDGLGLVSNLEQLHLPQIIAMREPVPDRIAQEFLKYFLRSFAQGQSLYRAVRQARERLQGWEGEFPCASWLPVICQNSLEMPPDWQSLGGVSGSLPAQPQPASQQGRGMGTPMWQRLKGMAIVAMLLSSLLMGVRSLGMLQSFELRAFDQMMQLRPAEPADDRIVVISVGEADIQYQDQQGMARRGSLSDQALLRLIQILTPHQPRLLGLDVYHDFAFDPALAERVRAADWFFSICRVGQTQDTPSIAAPPGSLPESIGFSDWAIDPDGVVRRQLLGMTSSEACPTSQAFSLRIALGYLQAAGVPPLRRSPAGTIALGTVGFPRLAHNSGGYQLSPMEAMGYQILLNRRCQPADANGAEGCFEWGKRLPTGATGARSNCPDWHHHGYDRSPCRGAQSTPSRGNGSRPND
ncbi:MAG: CHASE2 domain-containing protein [Leptolyngbyaceae cyanobacterium SL_7_1]|nr:CHASE2 domain-containing protein [Leptolyngbyaceae cyanobacterium SL_7_1]